MANLPEPVTVQEALRAPRVDIEVSAGQARWFGPFDEHAGAYHIAEIKQFEDLRDLRLIPDGISEQEASDALLADEAAFRVEQKERAMHERACSCQDELQPTVRIGQARRSHANLTDVLQKTRGRLLEPTDPEVLQVYHHVRRWLTRGSPLYVGLASAENIVIGLDGMLVMDPTVHVVHAGLIELSSGSRLRFMSGSVNVSCATLTGPDETPGPVPPYHPPPTPTRPPIDPDLLPRSDLVIGKFLRGFWKSVELHSAKYPR
jgi:hypothetical protein